VPAEAGCRARSGWSVFRAGEHSKIHASAWDYGVLRLRSRDRKVLCAIVEICILRNARQERAKRDDSEHTCSPLVSLRYLKREREREREGDPRMIRRTYVG